MLKIKVTSPKPCIKELKIEVPPQEVTTELEMIFEDIKKVAQVPGFRPGKAPLDIIRLHYTAAAHQKLLDRLIPSAYQQAISAEKITPLELPQIKEVNFKPDQPLSFTAMVSIRPQVKLKNYNGIKLKKKDNSLKEEELTQALAFLQERNAQYHAVENRGVAMDDYIICDLEYSIAGQQIEKKENIWIYLKENAYMTGFVPQVIGAGLNETRKFSLTIPGNFPHKEQAGKAADFTVTIKEIKIKKSPELTDEFAKDFGKNTLEELKASIKEGLLKEKEMEAKLDVEHQLIDALVKANNFDVPETLVEKQAKSLLEQRVQRLLYQGYKQEDVDKQKEILRQQADTDALRQVKSFFIMEKISELESISVTAEEIDKRIEVIARSYQKPAAEVKKYFNDKEMLHELEWELKEGKVKEFLLSSASITEEK